MATMEKTESFLYSMLPTCLGVLMVATVGLDDLLTNLSIISLVTFVGSTLLYTVTLDEMMLFRVYRRDASKRAEEIMSAAFAWVHLTKSWYVGAGHFGGHDHSGVSGLIISTIESRAFMKRLWRIRFAFYASLSVGTLLLAAVVRLYSLTSTPYSWPVTVMFLYSIPLVPFLISRNMQRKNVSNFLVSLSQYYCIYTMCFELRITEMDNEESSAKTMSAQFESLEGILAHSDWSLFVSTWTSILEGIEAAAKEAFGEDCFRDMLKQWSDFVISRAMGNRGPLTPKQQITRYLVFAEYGLRTYSEYLGPLEKSALQIALEALVGKEPYVLLTEDFMRRIVQLPQKESKVPTETIPEEIALLPGRLPYYSNLAEVWMWLDRMKTHSKAAMHLWRSVKRPSVRNMDPRTRAEFLKYTTAGHEA